MASQQPLSDRKRTALRNLLYYETEQIRQEGTRRTLGPPYGRAPPPKLPSLTSLRNLAGKVRPVSIHKDGHHRTVTDLRILPSLSDEVLSDTHFLSPTAERYSSLSAYPEVTSPLLPKPSFFPFATVSSLEDSGSPDNPFERPNGKCYFFPLEMFMDWTQLPVFPANGWVKQTLVTDMCEWRPCSILSHEEQSRKFQVQIGDFVKLVSRQNLRFEGESEGKFNEVIEQAQRLRRSHEGFVRYFARFEIALAQSSPQISPNFLESQTHIFRKMALRLSSEVSGQVKNELWDLYSRSVLKFVFDTQYFAPKAELMLCPWKFELTRQERWWLLIRSTALKEHPYQRSKQRVEDRFMRKGSALHLTRLVIYQRLTKLRWGDYYSCLKDFRNVKTRVSFFELKKEFRAHFAKATLAIDTAIKQLSDQVFKVLETAPSLLSEVDSLLEEAQRVLESNLQYAVHQSVQRLVRIFEEYYPILPLAGEVRERIKQIPSAIIERHYGNWSSGKAKCVNELQSIAIVKEMIGVIYTDMASGKLHHYPFISSPAPLLSISIESRLSRDRLLMGKAPEYFNLAELKWEIGVSRAKASKLRPTSRLELSDSVKVNKVIRNVLQLTDECLDTEGDNPEVPSTLLDEAVYGWVSAGKDKMIVDLYPTITEIDIALQKLLKAPLKNILRIKRFSLRPTEKHRIKLRNATMEIRTALSDHIAEVFQYSMYGPVALLALLREFDYLFCGRITELFTRLVKAHVEDYPGLISEIRTIEKHKELIQTQLPESVQFGFFLVQLTSMKQEAKRNAKAICEALTKELSNEHLAILTEVTQDFEGLIARLSQVPQSVEEMDEMNRFLEAKQDEAVMSAIKKELEKVRIIEEGLEEFQRDIDPTQSGMAWKTKSWENQLQREKQRLLRRIQRLTPTFQETVQKQVNALKESILRMKADMSEFVTYSDLQNSDQYASQASDVLQRLQALKEETVTANTREKILLLAQTDFQELVSMEEQFVSFHVFWNYASEWSAAYLSWMEKPLALIDPEVVQARFSKGLRLTDKMKAEMSNNVNVMRAVQEQEELLRAFEHTIPLLYNLRQDSLRDRHWRKIWDLLGKSTSDRNESERKSQQSLRELLVRGISKRAKEVESIANEAKSEFEIEKIWTKIDKELRAPSMLVAPHPKHSEIQVIAGLEGFKDKLHEYLTTINYLTKANRHIDPFREQLKSLEQMIAAQQSVVEDLHEFQELICELYPLFKVAELCEQLPRTAARMAELVDYYVQQLAYIETVRTRQNNTITVRSEAKFTYPEASAELKKLREDVRLRITEKQELCSRLYFLSDLQILELLSAVNSQAPFEVAQLFPGVDDLIIEERVILGFLRFDLQTRIPRPISLRQGPHARNLEEWVSDLEKVLRDQQAFNVNHALKTLGTYGLQWDLDPDHEVAFLAYFVWFSQRLEGIMQSESCKSGLETLYQELHSVLEAGIQFMKPRNGRTHDPFSIELFALVETPLTAETRPHNEFFALLLLNHIEYIQKLRENEAGERAVHWKAALKLRESPDSGLILQCFDHTLQCGFEMHSLDFMQSVVFTPLTERHSLHIYLTLKHGLGCILTGDAAYDKTETVKFLALAAGKAFQQVSLTASTPFDRVVKFLIGCATGGYWGCFEEIHALEAAHLSTLSKYSQTIQSSASANPCRLNIDVYQVKPKLGFALFCTSNLSHFPATVHEAFRILSVPQPDLALTATVMLQVSGVPSAKKYGKFIANTVRLLDQPVLSLTSGRTLHLHMKANTRTLMRVIKAFVAMDRERFMDDKIYLINNAFRQVYGLGLPSCDLIILDECLASVFQSLHNDKLSRLGVRGPTSDTIKKLAELEKVKGAEVLQRRCEQLFRLLMVAEWPWVFVVGSGQCGKSTVISLVSKVVSSMTNTSFRVHRLGPVLSSQSLSDLYEHLSSVSSPWFSPSFSGSYSSTPLGPTPAKYSPKDWIHIDGRQVPYSSDVLLALVRAHPYSQIKLVIECESLDLAAPSIVTEAGLLQLEKSDVSIYDYYLTVMTATCGDGAEALQPSFERLYESLMLPTLRYIEKVEQTAKVDSKFLVEMFARVLKPFMVMIRKKALIEANLKAIPLSSEKSGLVFLRRSNTSNVSRLSRKERPKEIDALEGTENKLDVLKGLARVRRIPKVKHHMAVEAVFLVSLVNSFANFVVNTDAFSNMLLDLVKSQEEDFAGYLEQEYTKLGARSLLEMTFSVKEMTWTMILSLFSLRALPNKQLPKGPLTHKPEHSLSYLESIACRYVSDQRRDDLVTIPTFSTQRLSYWVEFCYRSKVDVAVFGPHQSGKSVVTMAVAKELLGLSFSGLIPLNISSGMNSTAVQDLVETSMESRTRRDFGGVGGAHFYAILDDMNLDASYQIYDLLRFWRETAGWYSNGFTGISDLTVALVHSYVEGKSRPLYTRAMRHFCMLYKSSYSESELTSIFKQHIDAGPWEESTEGMLSVAEDAVRSMVSLFRDLALQQHKTEQMWCQLAISNFCQGLRFVAQFDLEEDIDIPHFLKLWTFMMSRFFLDQFGGVESTIRTRIQESLQGIVEKFTDSEVETEHVLTGGVLIPVEEQLREEGGRNFSEFELLSEESLETLITTFRESRMHASLTFPNRLKHLHSLLFDVENRLSTYVFFYLNSIYDVKSSCPSVVVRTAGSPGLVKALLYMAADTMNVKVFEFNSEEKEDAFSGSLMENFKSFSSTYLPTEPRFEVKRIMEETMMHNKRVLLLLTLRDQALERPLTRRFMEIALDIVTGVKLRLAGFSNYYKEFVDRFRKNAVNVDNMSHLYNDEVLQLMLDRMRSNVTLFFVLSSAGDSWGRSPLHPVGVLEQFKHEYRTLFNKSRVVDFDRLQAPAAVVDLVRGNEGFVEDWRLSFNTELLRECGQKIETLGEGMACDEYTYECVVHCCNALMQIVAQRRDEQRSVLSKAIAQIQSLQSQIRKTDSTLEGISTKLSGLDVRLRKYQAKLQSAHSALEEGLAIPYEEQLLADIESKRVALEIDMESAKTTWEAAIDTTQFSPEDASEMEKTASNPTALRLIQHFHTLVTPSKDQSEKSEAALKKFISQLGKKWKEYSKRLRHLQGDNLPNLTVGFTSCDVTPQAKVLRPLRGLYDLMAAAVGYREAFGRHIEACRLLDAEKEMVGEQAETIRSKVLQDQNLVITKLQEKLEDIEKEAVALRLQSTFITDKKADLLDLAQNLLTVKETWTNALASYDEDEESALGECLIAGFYLVKGMRAVANQRKAMWKTISKVLDKYGYDCQDADSLTPRLLPDFHRFSYELVKLELADSGFFMESAAFLRLLMELKLPFPVIYDPFDVAFNYLVKLEEQNEVLVGKVSADAEFERRFKECVTEGKPVVCQNPSHSLFQAVFPALLWRANCFLMALGNLKSQPPPLKLMQKTFQVHPNFRLYICHTEPVPVTVKQQTTEVNFDATDKESWEGVLVVPLLKLLDGEQYQAYVDKDVQLAQSRLVQRDTERAFLDSILRCDPHFILLSEALEEQLSVACHKLFFTLSKDLRRISTLERFRNRTSSLVSLSDEEMTGPREKLGAILGEFYDLKTVLETLESALEDYSVSGKSLYLTTLRALNEHIRNLGVPAEVQWDALAESLGYNVFVRLSQSMSLEKRTLFACFYGLFKTYQREQTPRSEFFQVLEDIIRLDPSKQDLETDLKYLRTRYPSLFPSFFSPGSASFKLFLERELFADAKLPDTFPSISKFLLYAYLRPDLLPVYASRVIKEVIGQRFAYIPEVEIDIHSVDPTRAPFVVFYEGRAPLEYLRRVAEGRKVAVVNTQPLIASVVRTGKMEIKGVGRLSEAILTSLNESLGSAKWLVVQNLQLLTGLEAEVTIKFLLTKTAETSSDNFRVFILFPGRPADYPEWDILIRHSQRVVLPEPQTVREFMVQWRVAKDVAFYALQSETQLRLFWANCVLNLVMEKEKVEERKVEIGKKRVTSRENSAIPIYEFDGLSLNPKTEFNTSLLCSIVYLRQLFSRDLSVFWSQSDAQAILKDFLDCLPTGAPPSAVLTPSSLSLFSSLMALDAGHFPTAALVSLAQQVLGEERSSLLLKSKEGATRLNTLEYPLYSKERCEPQNTQAILARYPAEDHLSLTGLSQGLMVAQRKTWVPALLETVAALPLTIADSSFYLGTANRLSQAGEKERVIAHLQLILTELVNGLPEPGSVTRSTRTANQNHAVKRQKDWFGKDKSPSKQREKEKDMRNSVLDSPPLLAEVLEVIRTAETHKRSAFLKNVRKPLVEMLLYLTYSRSILSPEDTYNLAEIAHNRVPTRWLSFSPFTCRDLTDVLSWQTRILRCFQYDLSSPALDLSALFDPELALSTLLRATAVSLRKKAEETVKRNRKGSEIDYPFSEFSPPRQREAISAVRSDQMGFEVTPGERTSPELYQIKVLGLVLTGAKVNRETGVLEDSEKQVILPSLIFTPVKLPGQIRNNPAYPPGLKLLWGLGSVLPWDTVAQVNALMHELSAYPKQGKAESPNSLLVYCPVRIANTPAWLLTGSREGQGYWSRKGASVDLL